MRGSDGDVVLRVRVFLLLRQSCLKKGRYAQRTGVGAPVYLAAVLEYLAAEVSLSDPKISLSAFFECVLCDFVFGRSETDG